MQINTATPSGLRTQNNTALTRNGKKERICKIRNEIFTS